MVEVLIDESVKEKDGLDCTTCTKKDLLNSLSTVSALYLYTGVPPVAYGSQAPKVAETVIRAYGFNHNEEGAKTTNIGGYDVEDLHWKGLAEDFPVDRIHSNFIPSAALGMCKKFLIKNVAYIDEIADKTIDTFMNQNADLLTKGRQTCCPLTNRSIPAAAAYKNMYDFLVRETGQTIFSGLEWIQAFCKLLEKEEVVVPVEESKMETRQRYSRNTKQRISVGIIKKRMANKRLQGKDVKRAVLRISTSFEAYLKSLERAKLDRRAIASPNMILRMFLAIIEEFHLELGNVIEGSTISIGGEKKKQKISATLSGATITSTMNPRKIQATEDATKWNECLPPALFALMHKAFFDPSIRDELGLKPPTPNGILFSRIAVVGNFLMSIKRIKLGPGPIAYSETSFNRLQWCEESICRMNAKTREWYLKIKEKMDGDLLFASPGMLMGMMNAASTTIGLLSTNYMMDSRDMKVVTLRSSDDSMSVFVGKDWPLVSKCVSMNFVNLSLIGINLSPKKTLFFPEGFGEYTSWYQDGVFVSQYGVETSGIRPQGKNPPDDFYSISKGCSVALQTFTINPLGATIRLRLGIDGVRRVWRIRSDRTRKGVSNSVIVLSDGGRRPWHFANSHLEETSLREHFAITEEDKGYLMRMRNPENPFSKDPEEGVSYSVDRGRLVVDTIETPRTVFHYCKRSNRTINSKTRSVQIENERHNAEALSIIRLALPNTYLRTPSSSTPINLAIRAALILGSSNCELSEDERKEVEAALFALEHGKPDDDEEENNDDVVDPLE
jgi:hypothetical protein